MLAAAELNDDAAPTAAFAGVEDPDAGLPSRSSVESGRLSEMSTQVTSVCHLILWFPEMYQLIPGPAWKPLPLWSPSDQTVETSPASSSVLSIRKKPP